MTRINNLKHKIDTNLTNQNNMFLTICGLAGNPRPKYQNPHPPRYFPAQSARPANFKVENFLDPHSPRSRPNGPGPADNEPNSQD